MENSRSFLLQQAKRPKIIMFTSVTVMGGLIIAFLFAYVAFGSDSNGTTLKYVAIIFRHGDKNPTSSYANDPYKESIFWPEGWGQLTNKGKNQMFQLGQFFHSRYSKFLGSYYSDTVRVDSSDHDRCHQSAGAMLAALFPPHGNEVWNSQLLWQPIPIHATPLNSDKLIVVKAPCPLYNIEKQRSDEALTAEYEQKNAELYNYLTEHTGQNISTLLGVETLFNILEIERDSGKVLPGWTVSVFPDKMKDIAALILASFTYTPTMKRLKGGPIIGDITTNMLLNANGTSRRKLSLYSAHDVTLVSVRRALGFNDITFKPGLGSALIVELHVIGNEPQVELYFRMSSADSNLVRWEVPACPAPCTLSTFRGAMSSVIPINWDTECQSKQ